MRDWNDEPLHCPSCGHNLSRWSPPEPDRTERAAIWVASHVASWLFPAIVASALATWIIINAIWQPFDPHPTVMLAVISALLATIAALQGPLILTAQRRSSERDRLRDQETLRVAMHTERDIHRIESKLDSIVNNLDEN